MSILGLLPLLLATSAAEVPLDMARWQACRQESSPLVRLACYDAIGNEAASAAEGAAPSRRPGRPSGPRSRPARQRVRPFCCRATPAVAVKPSLARHCAGDPGHRLR